MTAHRLLLCVTNEEDEAETDTLVLTERVMSEPGDPVIKSQLATVDDTLTHRSNAGGHNEQNRKQVGESREL